MSGIRERNRADVEARLLAAARAELRRVGAAALSVRAVARELGMAPSALFRYVDSRDDLLTLLIVDAYGDLGDHIAAALAPLDRADLRGRWRAIAHGVRDWAHAHPHQYALLYGSPVPEYHAPAERTADPGTRVINELIALARDAPADRPAPGPPGLTDAEAAALAQAVIAPLGADGPPIDARRFTNGTLAWTSLLGAVSAEVFEQLGAEFARNDALFEHVVAWGGHLLFGPLPR